MGYACPVCGDPQADAEHLANHLAITAIARGGDHEGWLDEQVPDWSDRGEAALAEAVVPHAAEADYPQVFEDTTGHDHGRGAAAAGRDDTGRADGAMDPGEDLTVDVAEAGVGPDRGGPGDLDPATREAIQEARAMMDRDAADATDSDGGEADSGAESETE